MQSFDRLCAIRTSRSRCRSRSEAWDGQRVPSTLQGCFGIAAERRISQLPSLRDCEGVVPLVCDVPRELPYLCRVELGPQQRRDHDGSRVDQWVVWFAVSIQREVLQQEAASGGRLAVIVTRAGGRACVHTLNPLPEGSWPTYRLTSWPRSRRAIANATGLQHD